MGLEESLSLRGVFFCPMETWPFVKVPFAFVAPLHVMYSPLANVESDGAMPGFPGGGTR